MDRKDIIIITIGGEAKTGKSVLALFLQKCLARVGVETQISLDCEMTPEQVKEAEDGFQKSLAAIVEAGPLVTIQTVQLPKKKEPSRIVVLGG